LADGISAYNYHYHWRADMGPESDWPRVLSYLTSARDNGAVARGEFYLVEDRRIAPSSERVPADWQRNVFYPTRFSHRVLNMHHIPLIATVSSGWHLLKPFQLV